MELLVSVRDIQEGSKKAGERGEGSGGLRKVWGLKGV